ncbi:MAG: TonB-dependent receptor [Calditrichia bacterium]
MKTVFNFATLTAIFFSIMVNALFGQSANGIIKGKVVDAMVQEPLIGANIVVIGTNLGASTDENGEFTITNLEPGSYQLEISYIGYISLNKTDIMVAANKPVYLSIALKPNPIQGEEITVTAGYFIEEQEIEPSLITLSREEIRRFPGGFEDVVRTVATLPGVAINNGGGRNDLLVRGGGPAENLYVVNSIEIPNINHFGTQGTSSGSLSFINLDLVENVEFSAGGFNAEYGDKLSSVLSLSLTKGRDDRLGGKALISATQFGANLEGPIGGMGSFIFSARRSYLDFIFKAAGLPFTPVYTDFNFVGEFDLSPRDKFTFLSLLALDDIDRFNDNEEKRSKNASVMGNKQSQWINGINYKHIMNGSVLDITLQANRFDYTFNQADENLIPYFSSKSTETELGLKTVFTKKLKHSNTLMIGAGTKVPVLESNTSFADTIYDQNGRKVPFDALGLPQQIQIDQTTNKSYAFARLDLNLTKSLSTIIGIRWDYYDFIREKHYISPRLGLKYSLSEKVSLKANYGIYYQSPSFVWIYNPENENLKALRNNMTVLGLDYLVRNDVLMKVEGYVKQYDQLPSGTIPNVNDYLVQTNTGLAFGGRDDNFKSFGFYPMASVGEGISYGVELQMQKKYSEIPFYGQISISIGKAEVTAANGKTYPAQFDQRFIFNITGGYKIGNSWEFGGKFRYFTGAPVTPVYIPENNPVHPGFIQNLPDEYLKDRLPAGHHLDLRIDRYFYYQQSRITLYLDVQNVYNYKIPIIPSYDFWDKEIVRSNAIALLPSIGISVEY